MTPNTTPATSADYEILRLSNQLCFAIYAATRAITKTYRKRLGPMGLTYPQYLVLLVLWEEDGLALSDIGNRLMLDSGTLTPLVKRLEAMGIVARERGADDERKVKVNLTREGRELKDHALGVRRFLDCRIGLSPAAAEALKTDLVELIDRLNVEERPAEAAE